MDLVDVGLDVPLEAQPADHQPGANGHDQAGGHVGERDHRAEEPPQQDERDLVDHRRGNEEGEGDAERHARLHEADEQRHRRA